MDTVFIREFRVEAWVGIYEWEKQRAQTLDVEIEIGIPGSAPHRTDNIHDTVNYGEVVERIRHELAERRFKLLEALAEHVCGDRHRRVQGAVGAALGRQARPRAQRAQGGRDARAPPRRAKPDA